MQVDVTNAASKQIKRLAKQAHSKVTAEIKTIASSSNVSDIKSEKLSGTKDRYKIRVGNYRIVYKKHTATHIEITAVSDRKDIYNKLFGLTFSL